MKAFMIVLAGALTFATCGPRNSEGKENGLPANADGTHDVILRGKVTNPQPGKIYINELRNDREGWKDSIELKADNTYEKKLHITDAGYFALNFYNRQMFNVILYKSNVTINVDGNSQDGRPEIIGSPENDLVTKVQSMVMAAQNSPEMEKLKADAAGVKDDVKIKELQDRYAKLVKAENDKIAAYLLTQPASLATMEILSQGQLLSRDEYENVYQDASNKLKKELPNSIFVKPFVEMVEKGKSTVIGAVAPEIELPDPTGKVIKLSSLRGKYVLVDFWAKWCSPCRHENPTVVAAYHKFKAKGFEVFGVSLDRDKNDWIQAIREDGLVWTQVSDLKYFQSKAASDYSVQAIPFSILLDPKGVIVAKNLRGPALDQKLTELLGK